MLLIENIETSALASDNILLPSGGTFLEKFLFGFLC